MKIIALAAAFGVMATAAFADSHEMAAPTGDAEAGQAIFDRNCVACHVVVNDEGETLAGRNARTGPNLYNVTGRGIGAAEDFNYSDAIVALNEQGEQWTEENFVGYVQDPTGWLREITGDNRARGRMAFQLRSEEDAANVYAFLASLAPAADTEEEASADN
ncbi:c-type cytochrome [Rhodobacterales bacterium HKCCE4037]|nr:c-type cytochrome [Rhodobacterales bacterium HKCCE4037]